MTKTAQKMEMPIKDLRHKLKELVCNELEQLPQLLEQLEPKDRLNFIVKFIPYVLPKTQNIHYKSDEPDNDLFTW